MKISCRRALLIAVALSPALCFAQQIFIDEPFQGDTVRSPTVTFRMSVSSDFELGEDGRILIRVDGYRILETDSLRTTLVISPGTHEVEAQLVDMRSRPVRTSIPDQVKFTIDDLSD
jgi:hypothetical protein